MRPSTDASYIDSYSYIFQALPQDLFTQFRVPAEYEEAQAAPTSARNGEARR